jgi:hypothetical protein
MRLMHEVPGQGLSEAPAIAARMASRLGWPPAETERQLAAYRAQVDLTRRYRDAPAKASAQSTPDPTVLKPAP